MMAPWSESKFIGSLQNQEETEATMTEEMRTERAKPHDGRRME